MGRAIKLTKSEAIRRVREKYPEDIYEILEFEYQNRSVNIPMKCKIHGEFFTTQLRNLKSKVMGCDSCEELREGSPNINPNIINKRLDLIFNGGISFVSERFTNSKEEHLFKCNISNFIFKDLVHNVLDWDKCNCTKCKEREKQERTDQFRNDLEEKFLGNIELLSEDSVIDFYSKQPFKCKKHNSIYQRLPYDVLGSKSGGCKSCRSDLVKKDEKYFVNRVCSLFGEEAFDFSLMNFIDLSTEITLICKVHNKPFTIIPKNMTGSHRTGCPTCGKEKGSRFKNWNEELVILKNKHPNIDWTKFIYRGIKEKSHYSCSCGREFFESLDYIHSGNPCYWCDCDRQEMRQLVDFVEKAQLVHGTEDYDYSESIFISPSTPLEIYCNKCGEYFSKTPSSHVYGEVGCGNCKGSSIGEDTTKVILDILEVTYKSQVRLDECRNIRPLPFDFGIYKSNELRLLIEIDGHHHFFPVTYSGKYEKAYNNFIYRLRLDNIKDKYCEDNNIPLLRVPYWKFDNLDTIIERELKARNLIE